MHLVPRQSPRQRVLRHSLLVEPAPSSNIAFADYFDNTATILAIDDEHTELVAHARSTVEVKAPVLPMLFQQGKTSLSLFSTIATLGTPRDVTLQEVRIECLFPMDHATARLFQVWAGGN